MSLTVTGVILFVVLLALVVLECCIFYRELVARTKKHDSERKMYDTVMAYINEVLFDEKTE